MKKEKNGITMIIPKKSEFVSAEYEPFKMAPYNRFFSTTLLFSLLFHFYPPDPQSSQFLATYPFWRCDECTVAILHLRSFVSLFVGHG
jgi:hypothetical protein